MNRPALISTLAALERHISSRVSICRVLIAPDGSIVRRIHTGSFIAALDWKPPSLDSLIAKAKGIHDHE